MRDNVVVGITAADVELDKLKGTWRQVSPEELSHSMVFYVAEMCRDAQADQGELMKLRNIMLSVPVMFIILDGEDSLYWESYNQRQRTMGWVSN